MTYSQPARTTTRRIPRILVAGLLVVVAAIAAALGYRLLASSSSPVASPIDLLRDRELPARQSVDDHAGLPAEQDARQRAGGGQEAHLDRALPLGAGPHEPEQAPDGAAHRMSSVRRGALG